MINRRIEKYAVYSKNFRGLPDGWHNIRSCNFLVGENSAGKSSFLQLIQLLDAREHSIFFELCGIVEGLDTPSDVCSRANGATEVTIGILLKNNKSDPNKRTPKYFGRLATYRRVKDDMQLSNLTLLSDDIVLKLSRRPSKIAYRISSLTLKDERKHIENAKSLEEYHFKQHKRYSKSREAAWQDSIEGIQWQETISSAVLGDPNRRFHQLSSTLNSLHYGPMRTKTRRLYHGAQTSFSASGEHTAYMLKDLIGLNKGLSGAIEKFGHASGLFDRIYITSVKTEVKDKPFALQIEKSGAFYYVDELGYGVGQVLPIIADICYASGSNAFLIQQPELHLHPRAQSALGEVFCEAVKEGAVLVLETHSDYIVDRYRMAQKGSGGSQRSQIVYFDKDPDGRNRAQEIEIMNDGSLNGVPDGYRDFFVNESIDKFESLI